MSGKFGGKAMALVFCTRCGHRVSTTAQKCPGSGASPYALRNATELTANRFPKAPVIVHRPPPATALPVQDTFDEYRRVLKLLQEHKTAALIVSAVLFLALGSWAAFYLPNTPSYAVYQCYQEIKARDGTAAASCIDFAEVTSNLTAHYSEE